MQKRFIWLLVLLLLLAATFGCARFFRRQPRTDREEPKPPAAENKYVASTACQPCHPQQFQGWSETLHRLMVQDARRAGTVVANFTFPGNPFEVAKDVSPNDIVYTLGSKWKQRYAIKRGEDYFFLPAQWIIASNEWKPYFADKWDQEERAWRNRCIGCHTTGYNPETNKFAEVSIGCEACHGPGEAHVAKPGKDNIVNPDRLSAKKSTGVCAACHFRGKDATGQVDYAKGFVPGKDVEDFIKPLQPKPGEETEEFFADGASKKHHQQYQDYIQSKHYKADISCAACHESHRAANAEGELPLKQGGLDGLCTSCHREGGTSFPIQTPVDLDEYMPVRAVSAVEPDIRSHTFWPDQPGAKKKQPYGD